MPDQPFLEPPVQISRQDAEEALGLMIHPWHSDESEKQLMARRMLRTLETMGLTIMRVVRRGYWHSV